MTVPENDDELLRQQLDADQLAVASCTDRNLLVLAPPGSGKTRVLVNAAAHRVRHAEELVGYRHARVMCLTFGTDAAREMRQRLQHRPLLVPDQRVWVSNYHGLGLQLLHRYGHLLGWPREAALVPTPANHAIVAEAINDLELRGRSTRDTANAISDLKGRRLSATEPAESLVRIREHYDSLLADRHLRDFDDLILHTIQLLEGHPKVRQVLQDAYPFVFVDELQDTNVLQLDLLAQLVGPDSRVFAVADDDQMIYGWRDAHPANLSQYVERFEAEEISLTGNYRCPPNIVSAANAVIIANERRRADFMESRIEDRAGEVAIIGASGSQAQAVVHEIERAVAAGVPLGEIAVLAPHRFKFDEVLQALDEGGIRYVTPGGGQLSSATVVRILRLALRHLAGGSVTEADAAEAGMANPGAAADVISTSADEAGQGSPRGLLNRLLATFELGTTREPALDADAVRVLAAMVRRAIDDERPATSADLAAALILNWDRLETAALRNEQAVKIMTSFVAKGTEYRLVILPFLNAGLVPYAPRGKEVDWDEARRLFYVALTRAQDRVVLVHDADAAPSELLSLVAPLATSSEVL